MGLIVKDRGRPWTRSLTCNTACATCSASMSVAAT